MTPTGFSPFPFRRLFHTVDASSERPAELPGKHQTRGAKAVNSSSSPENIGSHVRIARPAYSDPNGKNGRNPYERSASPLSSRRRENGSYH